MKSAAFAEWAGEDAKRDEDDGYVHEAVVIRGLNTKINLNVLIFN